MTMTTTEQLTGEAEELFAARARAEKGVDLDALRTGWGEADDFGSRPLVIIDAHVHRIIYLEITLMPYAELEGPAGDAAREALKHMHPMTPHYL